MSSVHNVKKFNLKTSRFTSYGQHHQGLVKGIRGGARLDTNIGLCCPLTYGLNKWGFKIVFTVA